MKKSYLAFLMALMIGTGFCSITASKIEAKFEIISPDELMHSINFTMKNTGNSNVSGILLLMPFMPEKIQSFDSSGRQIAHSTGLSGGIFFIKINETLRPSEEKSYLIKIFDDSFISKMGDFSAFSYNFISNYDSVDFRLSLLMPDSYAISSGQGSSISPLPDRIYSSGNGIMLEWQQSMNYMDSKNFVVFFEKSEKPNNSIWIIAASGIIGLFIGAFLMKAFSKKRNEKVLARVLSKDEKAIVDLVLKSREISQKDIGQLLDMSKPKLSKLISELSKKGIIKISPQGRKNIIELNKEVIE